MKVFKNFMTTSSSGAYRWLDGTPLDYVNWADFEPSYTSDGVVELCGEMYPGSGKWNDRECLQKQGYVCRASKSKNHSLLIKGGTSPVWL